MRKAQVSMIGAIAKAVTAFSPAWKRADVMTRVRAALPESRLVIDTCRGQLTFCLGHGQDGVGFFRKPEPDTIAWIHAMPSDAVLWDIGANVGLYSLHAALTPGIRVIAFEPAANSYAALAENIVVNGMSDRITALAVALAERTQLDTLYLTDPRPAMSYNGFGVKTNQFDHPIDGGLTQAALGYSIDDFVARFAPPLPTHIKMDVDGIEPEILRGGRKVLSAPSVRTMIVEIEGSDSRGRTIVGLMADLGFVPVPKASPAYRNVVFERAATHR